jgi:hypothetical protein
MGCKDKDVPRDPEDLDDQLLILDDDAGVADEDPDNDQN